MFFIGIFGITKKEKPLNYEYSNVCEKCGELFKYKIFAVYNCFHFFFIPIFKWGKEYFAYKSCCNELYELDKNIGKKIEEGENTFFDIHNLKQVNTFNNYYN